MSEKLRRTQQIVSDCMDDILSCFKAGMKITVLVRNPENPESDFCMTDDDLDQVVAMIKRRKEAANGG